MRSDLICVWRSPAAEIGRSRMERRMEPVTHDGPCKVFDDHTAFGRQAGLACEPAQKVTQWLAISHLRSRSVALQHDERVPAAIRREIPRENDHPVVSSRPVACVPRNPDLGMEERPVAQRDAREASLDEGEELAMAIRPADEASLVKDRNLVGAAFERGEQLERVCLGRATVHTRESPNRQGNREQRDQIERERRADCAVELVAVGRAQRVVEHPHRTRLKHGCDLRRRREPSAAPFPSGSRDDPSRTHRSTRRGGDWRFGIAADP
jgi:hypothetical protein